MDLGDFENNTAYAQYSTFSIGDDLTKYTLNAGGYNGTAGDELISDGVHVFRSEWYEILC